VTYDRLILYFPVSSLVTLFANILENPTANPRARSDIRLMNSVIDFLSKLDKYDDNNAKKMFMVCSEFARIAKEVVDRMEKDLLSRKQQQIAQVLVSPKRQNTGAMQRNIPLTPDCSTLPTSEVMYNEHIKNNAPNIQASNLFTASVSLN